MTQKEIKKITLGGILSWIFGIIFAFAGLGAFTSSSFVAGFTMLIMGAVLLPPVNKLFKEKMNFELSKGIKIAIIIIGLIIFSMTINTDTTSIDNSQADANNQINPSAETQNNNQEIKEEPKATEPEAYYAGDKVEVGNFAYIINSYYTTDKIGQDLMGTFMGEKADGIFLVIDVTIENIAKESKTIWASNVQVVDDQDRTFEHDTTAEIYLEDDQGFSFEQMQPGLPKTGKIVFDVPKDIKGNLKISADSMWSDEFKYVSWNEKE